MALGSEFAACGSSAHRAHTAQPIGRISKFKIRVLRITTLFFFETVEHERRRYLIALSMSHGYLRMLSMSVRD
jgi:hypothetical protein